MRRVPPILAVLLFAGGLALWLPYVSAKATNPRDELGAALLAGGVVSFAVLYAGRAWQLAEKRQNLAAAYVEAVVTRTAEAATEAREFLLAGQRNADAQWELWIQTSREDRYSVIALLNFFERVGAAYNSRRADQEAIAAGIGDSAFEVWQMAAWFVRRLRAEDGNRNLFVEWETMLHDIRRRRVPSEII
jgi:hypothetical protein